jgi:hypothetical protein
VFQQPAAVNPQQQLPGLPQQQQPAANAPAIQLPPQQQAQPNIQLPQQTPPTSNMPGQQPAATGAAPVNVTTVATAAPADRPPMESPEELKNKSENAGSDIVMPPEVASVNVDGDQMATALENFQQNQD